MSRRKRDFLDHQYVVFDHPDHTKVVCKDCAFRWRSPVELSDGTVFDNGAGKGLCEIYNDEDGAGWKPSEILWQYADCKYYLKDEE